MKKYFILIVLIVLFSGCTSNKEVKNSEIKDTEAYCTSFGEVCSQNSQNNNQCEICSATQVSSYVSCHSKEFCENAPMK